jgi:ankyrin repeat protein
MSDPILNDSGMTELLISVFEGDIEWLRRCVAGGSDVTARSKNGYTALHWACDMALASGDREEIVAYLISLGADVNALATDGSSVLDVAESAGNADVIGQLLRAGATRVPAVRD